MIKHRVFSVSDEGMTQVDLEYIEAAISFRPIVNFREISGNKVIVSYDDIPHSEVKYKDLLEAIEKVKTSDTIVNITLGEFCKVYKVGGNLIRIDIKI